MGKMNLKGNIVGLVGTVISYEVNGKMYFRSRPDTYKRKSKILKAANKVFGLVSTHSSNMARCLSNLFLFKFNRDTYNSIRSWVYKNYKMNMEADQWNISVPETLCQLNSLADIKVVYDMKLEVEDLGGGKIQVKIPEMNPREDLVVPACHLINLKFIIIQNELDTLKRGLIPLVEQYEFRPNQAFEGHTLTIQCQHKPGHLVIVSVAVEYIIAGSPSREVHKDIAFQPGAVIAVGKMK